MGVTREFHGRVTDLSSDEQHDEKRDSLHVAKSQFVESFPCYSSTRLQRKRSGCWQQNEGSLYLGVTPTAHLRWELLPRQRGHLERPVEPSFLFSIDVSQRQHLKFSPRFHGGTGKKKQTMKNRTHEAWLTINRALPRGNTEPTVCKSNTWRMERLHFTRRTSHKPSGGLDSFRLPRVCYLRNLSAPDIAQGGEQRRSQRNSCGTSSTEPSPANLDAQRSSINSSASFF